MLFFREGRMNIHDEECNNSPTMITDDLLKKRIKNLQENKLYALKYITMYMRITRSDGVFLTVFICLIRNC